jgi:hypothetical protein
VTKRVRGAVRTHRRPGARPPSERSASQRRPRPEPVDSQLEIAEVVAEDIVEHHPAEAATELERTAARTTQRTHHKIKANSLLAARAATEYVYVSQDLRRITIVAGTLIVSLLVLWLLLVALKVVQLPFY